MAHCTFTHGLRLGGCIQPCCVALLPLRGAAWLSSGAAQVPPPCGWSWLTFRIAFCLDCPKSQGDFSSPRMVPISLLHIILVLEKLRESLILAVHKGFRRFQDRSCCASVYRASVLVLQTCKYCLYSIPANLLLYSRMRQNGHLTAMRLRAAYGRPGSVRSHAASFEYPS